MFRRIDHVELVPSDLDRSISFYTSAFGFRLKERRPVSAPPIREIAYLTLGDTTLELLSVDGTEAPGDAWRIGFRGIALEVDDMAAALAGLRAQGVEPWWGPVDLGNSERAEIKDPDGLMIELRRWKK